MRTTKERFGTRTKVSTVRAGFTSAIRANFDYFDSLSCSFIADKSLQLIKAPAMKPEIKSPSFSLVSYSFKVFQDDCSCFVVIHNLLAYDMIPISHKTFLSTRDFSKQSLGRACAFGLEFCFQSSEFELFEFNLSCIEELFITCYSNIVYSNINAENRFIIAFDRNFLRNRKTEKASLLFVNNKMAFDNIPFSITFSKFGQGNIKFLPSIESENTQYISFVGKASWWIIPNESSLDDWLGFCSFTDLNCLRNTTNSQLRWKTIGFSDFIVNFMMESDIISNFIFPCMINTELQGLGILPDSSNNLICNWNFEFDGSYIFHDYFIDGQEYKLCPYLSSAASKYIFNNIQKEGLNSSQI